MITSKKGRRADEYSLNILTYVFCQKQGNFFNDESNGKNVMCFLKKKNLVNKCQYVFLYTYALKNITVVIHYL